MGRTPTDSRWWAEWPSNNGGVKLSVIILALWLMFTRTHVIGWEGISYCLGEAEVRKSQGFYCCSKPHLPCCTCICMPAPEQAQIHPVFLIVQLHRSLVSILLQLETGGSSADPAMGSRFSCTPSCSWNKQVSSKFPPSHRSTPHYSFYRGLNSVSGSLFRLQPSEKMWFKPLIWASVVIIHHFKIFIALKWIGAKWA